MPVTVKVNGSSNSVVHKGSTGIVKSTAPDVCKTPSPGGPVPIPYPIIVSMSSDLANGSTTVKADGNMIAVKDCELSMCTGDEPGTAGGVVSSTFKKEAKFILFSFDVKIDGKNACRRTDKLTMNHQNTICMQGEAQVPVVAQPGHDLLQRMVNECNKSVSPDEPPGSGNNKSCTKLGAHKHKCVDNKIKDHCKANPPDGNPPVDPEKGYPRPPLGPNNSCPIPTPPTPPPAPGRDAAIVGLLRSTPGLSFIDAMKRAIKGMCYPDAAIHMGGGKKVFVDFKFPCPKDHPVRKGVLSKGGAKTTMSPFQQASYDTLGRGTGGSWASIVIRPV